MKISNEVKVGATALITIVVFIWLFNFLKGKDYFKKTSYYYSIYDDIGGLAESSPVEINGFKVGIVQSISLLNQTSGKLLVEYSVSNNFRLPVNSVAEIVPVSIIAGMKVQFRFGEGPGFYEEGDTIPGHISKSIIVTIEEQFGPVKDNLLSLVVALDSVVSALDDVMDPEFRKNIDDIVANLKNTSGSINEIVGSRETDLKNAVTSLTNFSRMLSENSPKIDRTVSNLEIITDTLAASDIYTTLANLKKGLNETSEILESLNQGKGSAGQLLTNDSLYANLSGTLANLNLLLQDMKDNPKKYVHFSLFGRKNNTSE